MKEQKILYNYVIFLTENSPKYPSNQIHRNIQFMEKWNNVNLQITILLIIFCEVSYFNVQ